MIDPQDLVEIHQDTGTDGILPKPFTRSQVAAALALFLAGGAA